MDDKVHYLESFKLFLWGWEDDLLGKVLITYAIRPKFLFLVDQRLLPIILSLGGRGRHPGSSVVRKLS